MNPKSPPTADQPLMTATDVAAYLRVSVGYVRSLTRSGRLRCYRLGRLVRFCRESVDALLNSQERG